MPQYTIQIVTANDAARGPAAVAEFLTAVALDMSSGGDGGTVRGPDGAEVGRWASLTEEDQNMTLAEFATAMRTLGITDAELTDLGGMIAWPAGHLPTGEGVCVTDDADGTGPYDAAPGLPFPADLNVARYAAPAGAGGLDFNDPVDVRVVGTPGEALRLLCRWVAGQTDY